MVVVVVVLLLLLVVLLLLLAPVMVMGVRQAAALSMRWPRMGGTPVSPATPRACQSTRSGVVVALRHHRRTWLHTCTTCTTTRHEDGA